MSQLLTHPEIERPIHGETAPYYLTYIDQVNGDDVFRILENQLAEAEVLFASVSEERSRYRYAPEKWSVRQVLNHVTDSERAFAFRALWFARGFEAPLPGYDQDVAAAGAEADNVTWDRHAMEFRSVRLSTLSLFANMPGGAWIKGGVASGNPFTVRSLAYIIAGHFTHHLNILRTRYSI
jgi:hypothetical protein